jgi:hypothetical protein
MSALSFLVIIETESQPNVVLSDRPGLGTVEVILCRCVYVYMYVIIVLRLSRAIRVFIRAVLTVPPVGLLFRACPWISAPWCWWRRQGAPPLGTPSEWDYAPKQRTLLTSTDESTDRASWFWRLMMNWAGPPLFCDYSDAFRAHYGHSTASS